MRDDVLAVRLRLLNRYLAQHPVLALVYRLKQHLCYLLLKKHRTRRQCRSLIPRLLKAIDQLRGAGRPQVATLGETLHDWQAEIATMWRFNHKNGITEGFHTKMEVMQRQAYAFRNCRSYSLRVRVL